MPMESYEGSTVNYSQRSTSDLNRLAAHARNRRDRFSFGSPHADEAVQEVARIERELSRRRNARQS